MGGSTPGITPERGEPTPALGSATRAILLDETEPAQAARPQLSTVPHAAKETAILTRAEMGKVIPERPSQLGVGSCAAHWPPVTGRAAASPGLPGRIGTIKRTDGTDQLTYDEHPLYTYIGDTAPGQARGNNLNLNGGLWHDVPVSR